MATHLDLDDVAAGNPLAEHELFVLREFSRLCREHRLHLAPHGNVVRAWPHGALWHVDGADHLDAARKVEERFNSL